MSKIRFISDFDFIFPWPAMAERSGHATTERAMKAALLLDQFAKEKDPIASSIIEMIKLRGLPMGFIPTRIGELVPAREEFGEGVVGPTIVTKEIYREWKKRLLQRLFAAHPKEYWPFLDFGEQDPMLAEGI